jgi:hypothetical protein
MMTMAAVTEQAPKEATLRSLQQAQSGPREANLPNIQAGFNNLASFELAQRAAKVLASSTLVPEHFRGNLPDCIIALEMAQRIGASALMVMQNLYVVHGRPGWSAQFVIACVNQCGRFTALRYQWSGDRNKDDWSCQASAVERSTGEKLFGPIVSIKMAKDEGWFAKAGSKWKTIPELMLMYRAGAWFGRTHAPELTMGLQTREEILDVFEAEADESGRFSVTTEQMQQGNAPAAGAAEEAA